MVSKAVLGGRSGVKGPLQHLTGHQPRNGSLSGLRTAVATRLVDSANDSKSFFSPWQSDSWACQGARSRSSHYLTCGDLCGESPDEVLVDDPDCAWFRLRSDADSMRLPVWAFGGR
jgi:hypothetical protein